MNSNQPAIQYALAYYLYESDQYEEARNILSHLIPEHYNDSRVQQDPNGFAKIYLLLGYCLQEIGDDDLAREQIDRAYSLNPQAEL